MNAIILLGCLYDNQWWQYDEPEATVFGGVEEAGPWFNIKMTFYHYKTSQCGDDTILRPSYLHNEISYTGKTASLYWIGTLFFVYHIDES